MINKKQLDNWYEEGQNSKSKVKGKFPIFDLNLSEQEEIDTYELDLITSQNKIIDELSGVPSKEELELVQEANRITQHND